MAIRSRSLAHFSDVSLLQAELRALIDPVEDQIRVYPLDERATRKVVVIGAHVIEERQDFWIIT
jgi:CRISPR/Cas system-associated endoribonuclease Cas2